jgi:OCT family organic cation transporter-like MFS transporter 18
VGLSTDLEALGWGSLHSKYRMVSSNPTSPTSSVTPIVSQDSATLKMASKSGGGSSNHNNNFYLCIVYINIVLYATCFQLQRPLEPFLVEKLTVESGVDSKAEYARLQSFFSIVQTIGSLVTGYLLDYFSVKSGFYLSFLASAMSYWLLSMSTSMRILYISKIPTVFQAGFLCAQLAISHSTADGADRLTALGRLTMSYTVGTILGPSLGGWIGASGDYYFGAKLAVAGSLLSVALTYLLPPLQHAETSKSATSSGDEKSTDSPSIIKVISKVWLLLFTKVVSGVAISMNTSAFPLILKNTFGFKESAMGFSMSSLSAVNSIATGLFLGPIVEFMGGKVALVVSTSLAWTTIVFFAQAFLASPTVAVYHGPSNGLVIFMICAIILSVLQYVLSPALTGESTSRVASHEKGTLLGLEHSLFAAARILTPQAGVYLLNYGGITLVSGCAGGIFAGLLLVWNACKHKYLTAPLPLDATMGGDGDGDASERKSK